MMDKALNTAPGAAMARLRRSLGLLAIAGIAMTVGALAYLARSGPMSPTLVFTVVAGVFVSILLGGGLMALGFFSASTGHDVRAAAATPGPVPVPDSNETDVAAQSR